LWPKCTQEGHGQNTQNIEHYDYDNRSDEPQPEKEAERAKSNGRDDGIGRPPEPHGIPKLRVGAFILWNTLDASDLKSRSWFLRCDGPHNTPPSIILPLSLHSSIVSAHAPAPECALHSVTFGNFRRPSPLTMAFDDG